MTDDDHSGTRRPTRKDIQRLGTKARLLDAARRLFAERGYDDTSVTEVAQEAGVTHALINVYFNGKAGLLYEIVAESNRDQIDRSAEAETVVGGTLNRLTRLIEIWAEGDLKDRRLAAVMLAYMWQWPRETETRNRAQLDAGLETARRILARGVAETELETDTDIGRVVEAIYALYLWGLRPAIFDDATIATCVAGIRARIDLVLDGVRRRS